MLPFTEEEYIDGIGGMAPGWEDALAGLEAHLRGDPGLPPAAGWYPPDSEEVRFWRSRGTERQQMKWFAYAAVPVSLFPLSFFGLPLIVDAVAAQTERIAWREANAPTLSGAPHRPIHPIS